jgi:hypothetical protein
VGVVTAGRPFPDNPDYVARLLDSLRDAGVHVPLDHPDYVAWLLDSLRRRAAAALAVTATTGVNHTPTHAYLAGITFNALD